MGLRDHAPETVPDASTAGEDRLVADPLLERRGFRTDGPVGEWALSFETAFAPMARIKQLPRERDRGFESAFLQERVHCELDHDVELPLM